MPSIRSFSFLFLALGFLTLPGLYAQAGKTAPAPPPDEILFTDGEKLIGHFVRSTGSSVVFKSDVVGEVHVEWSKIKELHTAEPFAVVEKGVKLGKHEDTGRIPQGNLSVADQKIEVRPAAGQPTTLPVAESGYVIDEKTFQKAVLHRAKLLEFWNAAITAGASLVEATQHSRTYTGSVTLTRVLPVENWMDRRNRTIIDFSAASGRVTQPSTPSIKTEIYHADAERDEYFSPRVYAFGQASFDHNFSQGLDLQQNYGGGIGWTILKNAKQALDLKASVNYIGQEFQAAAVPQHLIGSTFAQTYTRKLRHGMVFNELFAATPAWNNLNAVSGSASAVLLMPVYKHFSVTISTLENFLNNPPPGFKRMSYQFTTGLTYTLP